VEDDEEDLFARLEDHAVADDDEDSDDHNNVSPRHTPASQIAVLNFKSRLHQYNFVTNRNDQKFANSFMIRDEPRPSLAIGPYSHRVTSSVVLLENVNRINEEEKINKQHSDVRNAALI
jgi:hypothetical protein